MQVLASAGFKTPACHPELVSGPIARLNASGEAGKWMLERQSPVVKQVQHAVKKKVGGA
ncbi:hypothetical protein [Sphingorhabdus sp.]|jgi:hypothetical protein|uniref:hypothetical protein n=1 Tax=Sphingorhabdus sp. TaxID=1902408 RepID=UPI0037C5B6DF